jgi:hypothetical protein
VRWCESPKLLGGSDWELVTKLVTELGLVLRFVIAYDPAIDIAFVTR